MSSNLVDELLYYVGQREENYVRQRMMDTIGWGCQTYNRYDQEFGYGKKDGCLNASVIRKDWSLKNMRMVRQPAPGFA